MPAVFNHSLMDSKEVNTEYEFPTSCWQQFCILVQRLFLQQKRNSVSSQITFWHIYIFIYSVSTEALLCLPISLSSKTGYPSMLCGEISGCGKFKI